MTGLAVAKDLDFEPPPSPRTEVSDGPRLDGTVDPADLWRVLWHWRRVIIGVIVAAMASTLLYCLLTPNLYTAVTEIFIDPRDRVVMRTDSGQNTLPPDGGISQVESQVQVVQSPTVLLRAIKALDLASDPEFNGRDGLLSRLARTVKSLAGIPSKVDDSDALTDKTLRNLRSRLAVKRADKVFVVDVIVTARSPDKAARIANAIAQAYMADQSHARFAKAQKASSELADRLAEQRQKVNDAEQKVETFKAEHDLVAANGELVGDQQLIEVNRQLSQAQSRTAELKARLDQIDAMRHGGSLPGATAEAIQSTVVTQLRAREAELVQREADLKTQLGPRHPAIASIEAERRDVHKLLAAEFDRIARAAKADYDRARANEASATRSLDQQKSDAIAAKQNQVQLRALERDAEANRTIYATFLLRSREEHEESGIDTTNIRVIGEATPPQQRSWPVTGFLLLASLGAGLAVGAGIALIGEYLKPHVLSPAMMERASGAPVIGSLPLSELGLGGRAGSGGDLSGRAEIVLGLVLRRVIQAGRDRAEAVQGRSGRPVDSLLVGSAAAAPLQSWCFARLLAATAANLGLRVLLVDAGHAPAEGGERAGLLDVLRGDCALADSVEADPRASIWSLARGRVPVPGDPGGRTLEPSRLFAQARRHFDLIVIDGGVLADNPRVASVIDYVDDVLLLAERGATLQQEVAAAVHAVSVMGGRVDSGLLLEPA